MTLALIKNNIIENTIVADDESIASTFKRYIVVRIDNLDPHPGIGWAWDGENFIAPTFENSEL